MHSRMTMLKALFCLGLVSGFWSSTARAQAVTDYSRATHWAGAVAVEAPIGDPHFIGHSAVMVDGTGHLVRVDLADPYQPGTPQVIPLEHNPERILEVRDGRLYLLADSLLLVLDTADFSVLGSHDFPDITHLGVRGESGVLLLDGGQRIFTLDVGDPAEWTILGAVDFPESSGRWVDLRLEGSRVFLTREEIYTERFDIVDVSSSGVATLQGSLGHYRLGKARRSQTIQAYSLNAFQGDEVYTLEYYRSYQSSLDVTTYRTYLSHWILEDPNNPIPGDRFQLTPDFAYAYSGYISTEGPGLFTVLGPTILKVDLDNSGGNPSHVCAGIGEEFTLNGLTEGDGLLLSRSGGVLHVFRLEGEDGWEVASSDGGYHAGTALCDDGMISFTTVEEESFPRWQEWEISDPHNPFRYWAWSLDEDFSPSYCAISSRYSVIGNSWPRFRDRETGHGGTVQGVEASGFAFFQPSLGASVGAGGVHILDLDDPESPVLSHPSSLAVEYVTQAPGRDNILVVGDEENLEVWDVSDPEQPVSGGSYSGTGLFVPYQGGGPAPILAVIEDPAEAWPGSRLRLLAVGSSGELDVRGELNLPAKPEGAWLDGSMLYLACGSAGLIVVDVADTNYPTIRGGMGLDRVTAVRVVDDRLLLAGTHLFVLPLDEGTSVPVMLQDFQARSEARGVRLRWSVLGQAGDRVFRVRRLDGHGEGIIVSTGNEGSAEVLDADPFYGMNHYVLEWREAESDPWVLMGEVKVSHVPTARARISGVAPNPFNPRVKIACEIPAEMPVTVRILDVSGRAVATVCRQEVMRGARSFIWEGLDDAGHSVPSGTYLVEMVAGTHMDAAKVQLVR